MRLCLDHVRLGEPFGLERRRLTYRSRARELCLRLALRLDPRLLCTGLSGDAHGVCLPARRGLRLQSLGCRHGARCKRHGELRVGRHRRDNIDADDLHPVRARHAVGVLDRRAHLLLIVHRIVDKLLHFLLLLALHEHPGHSLHGGTGSRGGHVERLGVVDRPDERCERGERLLQHVVPQLGDVRRNVAELPRDRHRLRCHRRGHLGVEDAPVHGGVHLHVDVIGGRRLNLLQVVGLDLQGDELLEPMVFVPKEVRVAPWQHTLLPVVLRDCGVALVNSH
mmetsp:Transcript_24986/g.60360  ORF Transcript_24986/g.60360 Transcript_24986/m.60360 type:complete len:280 (+) Transcript_24986:500-1339(+)